MKRFLTAIIIALFVSLGVTAVAFPATQAYAAVAKEGATKGSKGKCSTKHTFTYEGKKYTATGKGRWYTAKGGKSWLFKISVTIGDEVVNIWLKDVTAKIDGQYYVFDSNGLTYGAEEDIESPDTTTPTPTPDPNPNPNPTPTPDPNPNPTPAPVNNGGGSSEIYGPKRGSNWKLENGYWKYYRGSVAVTGLLDCDGFTFYFDGAGQMVTGLQYLLSNWYYFSDGTDGRPEGAMVKNGFAKFGANWSYFGPNGTQAKSVMVSDSAGNTYYVDASGTLATGLISIGSDTFYFEPSTAPDRRLGVMLKNSWKKVGSSWYFFGADGKALKGVWVKQGESQYQFDAYGRLVQ